MAKKPLPTPDELRQLLRYEPETGKLFWRAQDVQSFEGMERSATWLCGIWNAKYSGKEAFTATCKSGHKRGNIKGRGLLAHRVIWAIVYGEWPKELIDHRNMNPADNRIGNLRAATKRQNGCNRLAAGLSRYLGVCWHKDAAKWKAAISVHGRSKALGLFAREADAALAYDVAARALHGEFARLNFPPTGRLPLARPHQTSCDT